MSLAIGLASPTLPASSLWHTFVLVIASILIHLLAAVPSHAQLDQSCTVSALNRTAPVDANSIWGLTNVPAGTGQVRVRAACVENGTTRYGQSDPFTVPVNGTVMVSDTSFASPVPIPSSPQLGEHRTESAGADGQAAGSGAETDSSSGCSFRRSALGRHGVEAGKLRATQRPCDAAAQRSQKAGQRHESEEGATWSITARASRGE
jgi:hypothetical protein